MDDWKIEPFSMSNLDVDGENELIGGGSAARTVVVELIDPESGAPVLTWTFRGCRVIHISHSPLDALVATVITESLVFEYADVDIN